VINACSGLEWIRVLKSVKKNLVWQNSAAKSRSG